MDKEAKTVFMFGLDEAIKRLNRVKEEMEVWKAEHPTAYKEIKYNIEKIRIPEIEDLKDLVLKMKEC